MVQAPFAQTPCWIDLFDPSEAEVARVQAQTGLHLPTRDELTSIESSSRFYVEHGAVYLSVPITALTLQGTPETTPFGVILTPERIVTLRFAQLPVVETLAKRLQAGASPSSVEVFLLLLERAIDVIADTVEQNSAELDRLSYEIYHVNQRAGIGPNTLMQNLRSALRTVGSVAERTTKLRDTLIVIGRSLPFVLANARWIPAELLPRFETVRIDVVWLNDYANDVFRQVQLLQEASIGFINIEQNQIIKLFAVVATVGVPPTLLASFWGMNFEAVPWLKVEFGYEAALVLIVASGLIPLIWFWRSGWL